MDTKRISRNDALRWVVNLNQGLIAQWECTEERHEKQVSGWLVRSPSKRKCRSHLNKELLRLQLLEYIVNRRDARLYQDNQYDIPTTLTIVINPDSSYRYRIQFRLTYKGAK